MRLTATAASILFAAITLSVTAPAVSAPLRAQSHDSETRSVPRIPDVARTAGQFTTLLAAVDAAGLTETLLGTGPFTVFAPTDDAFRRLPQGTVDDLLRPQNRDKLRQILTYHVIAGRVTAARAASVRSAETVSGERVRIRTEGGLLRINEAAVRIADIPARNGIVHVIDRVLLPETTNRSSNDDDCPCRNRNSGSRSN